jgi:hypothetical protein
LRKRLLKPVPIFSSYFSPFFSVLTTTAEIHLPFFVGLSQAEHTPEA